jgi:hypothetical protein
MNRLYAELPDIDEFDKAAEAYKAKFDALPTVMGFNKETRERARQKLLEAIEVGIPFPDDKTWYKALGTKPPPKDAVI